MIENDRKLLADVIKALRRYRDDHESWREVVAALDRYDLRAEDLIA